MAEGAKKRGIRLIINLAVLAALLIVFFAASFTTIPEGYMGLKYELGRIVSADLTAGLQFKLPFFQDIVTVDMREQVFELETTAYTKDSQTVESIQLKLNYRLDPAELLSIARDVGISNVESSLIFPQINTILKNELGGFRAEDLIQNRDALQENVESRMRDTMADYGVTVKSLSIVNIDFDDTFEEAVRAKVVAEQAALTAQNKTVEVEEESRQKVIQAQAEADSTKLKADADAYAIEAIQKKLENSPSYIEYLKITRWDGKLPQIMGDGVSPFVVLDSETDTGSNGGTKTAQGVLPSDAE